MKRERLNKAQRIQMKAFVCVLGLGLLIMLLLGNIFAGGGQSQSETEEKLHIPVVEWVCNVWIIETDEEGIVVFRDGETTEYPYAGQQTHIRAENIREQLADIELTDGCVTVLTVKSDKINARVLGADEQGVELEGYGKLPLAEDYKGYRIYQELAMCTCKDLSYGYSFADFVLEDDQICGILMVREEAMENIRVLIKTSDYAGLLHEQLVLSADTSFTLQYGDDNGRQTQQYAAGEEIVINQESGYFSKGRVLVVPDALSGRVVLKNVSRSQGEPCYRGRLELLWTKEGIAVINELPLEEYLYSVVPSEMPAGYPEEALKAQAICARTYAYGYMQKAGYPQYGAHMDDSTAYQVYNNILEQESTTRAVKETYGQLLITPGGQTAGTYYYSTSCGVGTDTGVWKTNEAADITYIDSRAINRQTLLEQRMETVDVTEAADVQTADLQAADIGERLKEEQYFTEFISEKNADDFEVTESWYRWNYEVEKLDLEQLKEQLQKRYQANRELVLTLCDTEYVSVPIAELSEVHNLYIAQRGVGGVADELIIETAEHTYKVISEYNIRCVLNQGEQNILRQDGSSVASPTLLPSGFFAITLIREKEIVSGYRLVGGGYGHGVGMSQNGAKHMAKEGSTAEEILSFFYGDCTLCGVYQRKAELGGEGE